jgi:hypothetical protein
MTERSDQYTLAQKTGELLAAKVATIESLIQARGYDEIEIQRLKAVIDSMEHDAIDNTFTIRNLLEVNKVQAAEIAALKAQLNTCKHLRVNIHSRLFAAETREEPVDYEQSAQCQDCGKWLAIEDIPEDSEVSE